MRLNLRDSPFAARFFKNTLCSGQVWLALLISNHSQGNGVFKDSWHAFSVFILCALSLNVASMKRIEGKEQCMAPLMTIAMCYGTTSILTLSKPDDILPILLNADFERSMMRPLTKGPRSLILTITLLPLLLFVTLTFEPKGKFLWAAVF
jgi:hypothetical protein